MTDELAGVELSTPGDSAPLAGLGLMRVGRAVLIALLDDTGVAAHLATIEAVSDDGHFQLDKPATPGGPVLDARSGALVGIVENADPTRAVGPGPIRRAMMVVRPVTHSAVNDLDPGVCIPRDVLIDARSIPVEVPQPAEGGQLRETNAFFDEILDAPLGAFLAVLFRNSKFDDVDPLTHRGMVRPTLRPDGRLLVSCHRLEISVCVPGRLLDFLTRPDGFVDPASEVSGNKPSNKPRVAM